MTLAPYRDDGEPEEVIVPVAAIAADQADADGGAPAVRLRPAAAG